MMLLLDWRFTIPALTDAASIFGARITGDGTVLDSDGFMVDSNTRWHFSPGIASNGSDYFAVWTDSAQRSSFGTRTAGIKVTADGRPSSAGPVDFGNRGNTVSIAAYGGDYGSGDYWLYWQQNDGLDTPSKVLASMPLAQPVRAMRIDDSGHSSQSFSFDILDYAPENPYLAEFPAMAYSQAGKFFIVSSSSASLARRIIGRTVSTLESAVYRDGKFTLTWPATVGKTYRVEYTTNILSAVWTRLEGDVVTTTGIASKTDNSAASSPQRFYRVMEVQSP